MLTAIIPHFYKERLENLPRIVARLQDDGADEIIIWNNDEPFGLSFNHGSNCRVIQSDTNLGCQGRFAAVKYATHSSILFQDNDILTSPKSLGRLRSALSICPDSIISGKGGSRYYRGQKVVTTWGKFELMSRSTVDRILEPWSPGPDSLFDDQWLSIRAHKLDIPIVKIRINFDEVEHDVGFRFQKESLQATESFRRLMDIL